MYHTEIWKQRNVELVINNYLINDDLFLTVNESINDDSSV